MNTEPAPPKHAPILESRKRKVIVAIAIVVLAPAGTAAVLVAVSNSPAHMASPRACKVAELVIKDLSSGAVNGQAMGNYASALDFAARQPSAVTGEARTASADALAAQQDVSNGDFVTYKTDARRFINDLRILTAYCEALADSG